MFDLAPAPHMISVSRQAIADEFRAYLAARYEDGDVPCEADQKIAAWLYRFDRGAFSDYLAEA